MDILVSCKKVYTIKTLYLSQIMVAHGKRKRKEADIKLCLKEKIYFRNALNTLGRL